jgi:transcriptional repressor NrdR
VQGLREAFQHRGTADPDHAPGGQARRRPAGDRVENRIRQMGKTEIPTRVIGDFVIEELKELDPVSYIRYAIVYLGLEDLEAVREEIDRLLG